MGILIEEWRPVVGYEGLYEDSDWGRVRSLERKIICNGKKRKYVKTLSFRPFMKQYKAGDYYYVKLFKNGDRESKSIHRLVWESFNGEIPEGYEIDHIIPLRDGGTNALSNLRLVTPKENKNNPFTKAKRKNNKKVSKIIYQYSKEGCLLKIWPSLHELGRNGYDRRAVQRFLNGERKTYKGYIWSYVPL